MPVLPTFMLSCGAPSSLLIYDRASTCALVGSQVVAFASKNPNFYTLWSRLGVHCRTEPYPSHQMLMSCRTSAVEASKPRLCQATRVVVVPHPSTLAVFTYAWKGKDFSRQTSVAESRALPPELRIVLCRVAHQSWRSEAMTLSVPGSSSTPTWPNPNFVMPLRPWTSSLSLPSLCRGHALVATLRRRRAKEARSVNPLGTVTSTKRSPEMSEPWLLGVTAQWFIEKTIRNFPSVQVHRN
jgi:hypothetical protein